MDVLLIRFPAARHHNGHHFLSENIQISQKSTENKKRVFFPNGKRSGVCIITVCRCEVDPGNSRLVQRAIK
jgi:hypothetical protein